MEEMEVNHVDDIHEKLTDMVGDRVKVKANMGRHPRRRAHGHHQERPSGSLYRRG